MTFTKLSMLCTLPLLVLGANLKRATPDNFGLYGYGEGFGGFPLFYADVSPSGTGTSQSWIGTPNATLTNYTVSWSDVTLAIPSSSASDKRISFLTSNETSGSDATTTGFLFYGSTAMLLENGKLESSWFALRVSERIHALYWNDTSLGQVPVILRNTPPSNPST
ncbi:hypothetical protein N0V90_000232 [Kalmusia sp. IMI 367209]|nr:hypothetical protein N0V90_000232 [Kalmusia sp. IMI 367209]